MKIAIFDTHVLRPDGREMHFDILVRDQEPDKATSVVLAHGRRYLEAKGVPIASLCAPDGQVKFPHPWPPQIPPGRTPGL